MFGIGWAAVQIFLTEATVTMNVLFERGTCNQTVTIFTNGFDQVANIAFITFSCFTAVSCIRIRWILQAFGRNLTVLFWDDVFVSLRFALFCQNPDQQLVFLKFLPCGLSMRFTLEFRSIYF